MQWRAGAHAIAGVRGKQQRPRLAGEYILTLAHLAKAVNVRDAAQPDQRGLLVARLTSELVVGLEDGDDAAAVRIQDDLALILTTDFFSPVVDDAYDWGRIGESAADVVAEVIAARR